MLVAQARMESENASIRLRRKHEEMAKAGRPALSGTRAFGYNRTRTAIIPEESALIKEGVKRIIAGESIRAVARDWQERQVLTPTGRMWQHTPFRRMLASPTIAGLRLYHGTLVPGTWPKIISPSDSQRVRAILDDRAGPKRGTPRRYVLSGFAFCGRCGQRLSTKATGDGVRRYVCARQPGTQNCGRLARLAEPVEEVVRESVFVALDGVDLSEYVHQSDDGHTDELFNAIRIDEESLQQLSRDHYAEKRIGRDEYFAARDAITGRLEANRRQIARSNGHGLLNTVVGAGETVREQWDERGLDWQRAILGAVIDQVTIDPAVKGVVGRP